MSKKIYEFSYRYHTGTVAWIFHRLSGLALILYLVLHIWVIHNLDNPAGFNKVMAFLNEPVFKLLELGLWGVIVYHAINGMRVIFVDFFRGSKVQKQMFWGTVVLGIIVFMAGAIPFVGHLVK
jgi:succinate dehydrogenase cytochrome b subunit